MKTFTYLKPDEKVFALMFTKQTQKVRICQ